MNATKTAEIIALINDIRDAEVEWVAQGGIDAIGAAEVDAVASACGVTAAQVVEAAEAAGILIVASFSAAA